MLIETVIKNAYEYLNPNNVNYVIYHDKCQDGSSAAMCSQLTYSCSKVYLPLLHNNIDTDLNENAIRDKNVLVLDFSFKKDKFEHLRSIVNKIMILDHHESAMKDLENVPGCFFHMKHSGAVLAWYYFTYDPNEKHLREIPRFLRYIEDRDIWRWSERSFSEPMHYGLNIENPFFTEYKKYIDNDSEVDRLIEIGKEVMEENHKYYAKHAQEAREMRYTWLSKTYKVMCLEMKKFHLLSELAEYIYTTTKADFTLIWVKTSNTTDVDNISYKLSFRAPKENDVNVAKIAEKYGGGGHPKAAGANIDYSPWSIFS